MQTSIPCGVMDWNLILLPKRFCLHTVYQPPPSSDSARCEEPLLYTELVLTSAPWCHQVVITRRALTAITKCHVLLNFIFIQHASFLGLCVQLLHVTPTNWPNPQDFRLKTFSCFCICSAAATVICFFFITVCATFQLLAPITKFKADKVVCYLSTKV